MVEEPIEVEGRLFDGLHVRTARANILMIKAADGFLGCGYFDLGPAERLGEPVAIVTGVKVLADMLAARVIRRSTAAGALGIEVGMSGREALARLPTVARGRP